MMDEFDDPPRAYTAEELRDQFLDAVRGAVKFWKGQQSITHEARCEGVAHSILCLIDGVSSGFHGSLDLVCRTATGDKEFLQAEGSNWAEDGTVINDCPEYLHDLFAAMKS